MNNLARTESDRLIAQIRLDSLKSAEERNRLGQFATPPDLAAQIAEAARTLWGDRQDPVSFLEPSLGTGAFYAALRQAFGEDSTVSALGIEIDSDFAKVARNLWQHSGLRVIEGDFTELNPDETFNLILANPPYVRHHHLSVAQKTGLQQRVKLETGYKMNGLAGLYCYFLLLAHRWLEPGGLAAWLIPTEFMEVNYGDTIRRYLTERVTLLRVHRFRPGDVQFQDALVSSAIVIYEKGVPAPTHEVSFSLGGSVSAPEVQQCIGLEHLRTQRKWTQFPAKLNRPKHQEPVIIRFSDAFEVKRGIATGANDFFILSRDETYPAQSTLSQKFCH